ncbi:DMT family transporter [Marinitoga sp. 1155]|uniref:DMT family transporter n=1 Tax=Marinitoga sp. 1155 TaxID=1428448 RepID=UPI000640CEFA|nr:DMT family transporter [Marinitoga sp. 1155]KLO24374.1 membrane protein [Marinitoga sp. 1155]
MKKSIIYILLAAVLMGSTFPIQKIGLANTNPLIYVTLRFSIATIISFFIFKRGKFFYSFILGLVLSIGYISQIIGIKYTTATKAGFITSQYIILIPLFSYLIDKEKINKYQGLGFLFSIIGSYLLSGGINGFNLGDFLMILCAISFALHIVLITKFSKKIHEKDLLTFQFLTVTIISFFTMLFFKIDFKISMFSFLTILYSAIIGSIIVIFLQLKYQKKIGSNLTAILFLVQPIFSAFLSFFILKEQITLNQFAGSVILLFSILISNF